MDGLFDRSEIMVSFPFTHRLVGYGLVFLDCIGESIRWKNEFMEVVRPPFIPVMPLSDQSLVNGDRYLVVALLVFLQGPGLYIEYLASP